MYPELVTITPELAEKWLEFNEGNRRLPVGNAKHYERLLKAGEWMLTHQALAFQGHPEMPMRLLDGQTRLTAIKNTGIPAKQWVFWNCDENTFAVLDGGKPRSFADHHGWNKDLISLVNVLYWCASGYVRPTKHEADLVRVKFEPYHNKLNESSATKSKNISCSAVRAGFAIAMMQNPKQADEICSFYRHMTTQSLNLLPSGVCRLYVQLKDMVGAGRSAIQFQLPLTVKLLTPENWELTKIYQPKKEVFDSLGKYVKAVCEL
jgi:hypothetical protein